jgi:restriction endonuclease S subunit
MNITSAGTIDLRDARHVPSTFNEKRLSKNDVLFNNTNSPQLIGKTAFVGPSAAGRAFSNHMTRIVCTSGVDPQFAARQLHFLFSSGYFLYRCVKHVNQASISSGDLSRTVPLVIAPLTEQKRIVAKIEELFSELEAGEESLRLARRHLATYRQSLLKQAFEGKLTAKWRTVKVSEIGRIETGTTPPTANPANYGDDLPFFKPTDLEQGRYVKTAREHLSQSGQKHARVLSAGSVLVTCIGATIGKTGLAHLACATNQQINSISPNENILPEFAYYQAIGPRFQEEIKTNASSTTLPILNKSKFCALPFVVCPLPEQHRIVRLLDEQFEVIERNEREIDAALQRSEALRQSILHRAFTGKLVSQDPADEPATELLARLRAEKNGSSPSTKAGRRKHA